MSRRSLRRRYGHAKMSFGQEYLHDHAEIAGAAVGAGLGAATGGVSTVVGASIGAFVGAGVGLSIRRRKRKEELGT